MTRTHTNARARTNARAHTRTHREKETKGEMWRKRKRELRPQNPSAFHGAQRGGGLCWAGDRTNRVRMANGLKSGPHTVPRRSGKY